MKSALGTTVTLLVNVPTAAADAANLPANKRTAGTVIQVRSDDAAELVAAGYASFGSGGPETSTLGVRRATVDDVIADPRLRAALGASTVGNRLRRAAHSATRKDGLLPVMATPPVITTGASNLDATLNRSYRVSVAGQSNAFRFTGAALIPALYAGLYQTAYDVTMPGALGGNTPGQAAAVNTYQWSVEFYSDAPKVMLRMLTTANIQIEVNDQPVSAAVTTIGGGGGTMYALLDFTSAGGSAIRKIRVEMALASGFDGVYVGPTYGVWPPISETGIRVVTVGDSIDASTGATMPNGSWQKVAGKILGWTDIRQVSFGSTGFVNPGTTNTFGDQLRVADAVTHAPDLLVITGSQNDDAQTAAAITAAALATFRAYRTALPKVPIVVVGIDAASSGPSSFRKTNDSAVHAAFTTWADPASWWIENCQDPAGSWQFGTGRVSAPVGDGNRDRFGFDAAHPNDLGHAFMGYRFANSFRTQVLPKVA